jgi:predicted ArsR family transcriptional regulator
MERPNPFYRRSRISAKKFRNSYVVRARSATDAAQLTKTVTTIFLKIRERIAEECERESPLSSGEKSMNLTSALAACVASAVAGRAARIVFGLLKREGRVYTRARLQALTGHYSRPGRARSGH